MGVKTHYDMLNLYIVVMHAFTKKKLKRTRYEESYVSRTKKKLKRLKARKEI